MTAGNPGPVDSDRYVAALAGEDPLKSMKKAPKRLARLVEGLSPKKLQRRPAPGKWSVHEVLAHLADGEVVLGARMRMIASHDRPRLQAYDQDAFVERLGVERAKTRELLEDFAAARAANLRLLQRLPEGAFERVGVHEERGEETLEKVVRMYAGHDRLHEEQIESTLAALEGEKRAAKAERKAERKARREREAREAGARAEERRQKAEKKARKQGQAKPRAPAQAAHP